VRFRPARSTSRSAAPPLSEKVREASQLGLSGVVARRYAGCALPGSNSARRAARDGDIPAQRGRARGFALSEQVSAVVFVCAASHAAALRVSEADLDLTLRALRAHSILEMVRASCHCRSRCRCSKRISGRSVDADPANRGCESL
jgi:hypothetical protein